MDDDGEDKLDVGSIPTHRLSCNLNVYVLNHTFCHASSVQAQSPFKMSALPWRFDVELPILVSIPSPENSGHICTTNLTRAKPIVITPENDKKEVPEPVNVEDEFEHEVEKPDMKSELEEEEDKPKCCKECGCPGQCQNLIKSLSAEMAKNETFLDGAQTEIKKLDQTIRDKNRQIRMKDAKFKAVLEILGKQTVRDLIPPPHTTSTTTT